MQFNTWKNKISDLVAPKYSDIIIELFNFVGSTLLIDHIEEQHLSAVLDDISNTSRIIIAFDLEFQNTTNLGGGAKYHQYYGEATALRDRSYSFIREFGLVVFIKSDNGWYYIGNILLNFPNLANNINPTYIRYTSAPYASVTDKTYEEMSYHDSFFSSYNKKFVFNLYPYNCSELIKDPQFKDLILAQNYIYWADPDVKKRTLGDRDAKRFLDLFIALVNFSICVVKGQNDFKVFHNHYTFLNNKTPKLGIFKKIYDIEVFNGLSNTFFGASKLETTFSHLIKLKSYDITFFNKYIENLKAHNPVSDSLFTIIVVVAIHLIINNTLKSIVN